MIISDNNKNNTKKALKKEQNPDLSASLINNDDVKVNISLKNRTMHLRIAPYGVVWLKL